MQVHFTKHAFSWHSSPHLLTSELPSVTAPLFVLESRQTHSAVRAEVFAVKRNRRYFDVLQPIKFISLTFLHNVGPHTKRMFFFVSFIDSKRELKLVDGSEYFFGYIVCERFNYYRCISLETLPSSFIFVCTVCFSET